MIWVVSETVAGSRDELENRHEYIQNVTETRVSPWERRTLSTGNSLANEINIYQCHSHKGEYGVVVTAHIEEVLSILENILSFKRALVVIHSCCKTKHEKRSLASFVKGRNKQSKLFFAKQEVLDFKYLVAYVDDVGKFGFPTTASEREIFMHRRKGLVKAIYLSCDEVRP